VSFCYIESGVPLNSMNMINIFFFKAHGNPFDEPDIHTELYTTLIIIDRTVTPFTTDKKMIPMHKYKQSDYADPIFHLAA